jgi:hypothetical protein
MDRKRVELPIHLPALVQKLLQPGGSDSIPLVPLDFRQLLGKPLDGCDDGTITRCTELSPIGQRVGFPLLLRYHLAQSAMEAPPGEVRVE